MASIKTAWRTVCERVGVRATPHTLKHTAITWAMQAGVPLADAAGFLAVDPGVGECVPAPSPGFQAAMAAALDGRAIKR